MYITQWNLIDQDFGTLPCTAPCSMYSVLLEHGKMKDPFYGLNELELTALSDRDCTFTAAFAVDQNALKHPYQELTFHGLDTICAIYLNGQLLDKVDDMHIAYTYDVKKYLKLGENQIALKFSSPTRYFKEENAKHYLWTNGEKNGDTIRGAAHLRKALYMSGWDWGPKLPDMGIFRPVEWRSYDCDRIEDVQVLQHHHDGVVDLEITVETAKQAQCDAIACIDGQEVRLENGKGTVTIAQPRLWWARGYGEQHLYELQILLQKDGETLDADTKMIGLRTLTVSTEFDRMGREFCFVLNGVKIFAMGANYIPQDSFLCRISRERTERLIQQCADAHFNCLRVWGGGYYPEDDFFDLCDRYGLIVWQDFMVACIHVRLTKHFEENFVREAIYNLKRIRHHASLGLMCGNNEMEDMVAHETNNELVRQDYLRLYEMILPDICAQYAPQTFYWPSSPSSGGGFDDPQNNLMCDVHYWRVWHGGIPFTDYRDHQFRFCSEYGFEAFPAYKTICAFTEKKDRNIFSRVMENHQKCKSGNGKIMSYMSDTYLYPTSFESIVYASQMLQADAIKYGVEHFRRNRGVCMGSVYWQVNDCWPVASWSSIDYYGRYKALHYAAKKFYAPVALGLFLEYKGVEEKQRLAVNVSNETMQDFAGSVHVSVRRNDFSVISEHTEKVSLPKLSSEDVCVLIPEPEDPYGNYICAVLYDASGKEIMRQTELFVQPKHYAWQKPDIRVKMEKCEDGVMLTASSDCFAKGVYVDFENADCALKENFFDLTDAGEKKICIATEYTPEELLGQMKIRSVYDIGREETDD